MATTEFNADLLGSSLFGVVALLGSMAVLGNKLMKRDEAGVSAEAQAEKIADAYVLENPYTGLLTVVAR